ncbi:MAG: class F sortase [Cellulomonadaceae bacterium]|nr:class F sortase [Cellulomonadaceae bacterium]
MPFPHRLVARATATLTAIAVLGGASACSADGAPDAPPVTTVEVSPPPVPPPAPSSDVPVRSAALADATPRASPVPPVEVTLPGLGVSIPVDATGVAPDGQMEVPASAERAGWYRFGPAPGAPEGTAVIAAHVDSAVSAGLGPFAQLRDLAVGDPIDVTLQDGSVRRFTVTEVTSVAKPAVDWSVVFDQAGPPRLALVTCGGTFDQDARRYSDNVVVTAEPSGSP